MFSVYILKSQKNGRYYIGSTQSVAQRLQRHNTGQNRSTKYGIPWKVVYEENFTTKKEALAREFQIKSYKGGEAFKKLVKGL